MATRQTIKIPFTEKALTAAVRDHHQLGTELWLYDRGGSRSVAGLLLWIDKHGHQIYQLLKKINGNNYRRNLGDRQGLSVEQARGKAGKLIQELRDGKDPKKETANAKQIEALQGLTFEQALEACLAGGDYAEKTEKKYRQALDHTFVETKRRPLTWFTSDRVKAIHAERSKKSKAIADHDMRVLRLVWNWARQHYRTEDGAEILGPHPVAAALNKKVAGQRGWNARPPKTRTVPVARLPEWFRTLYQIRDEPGAQRARRTSALLLEFLGLTGLRYREAATLTREPVYIKGKRMPYIDESRGLIEIPDTSAKGRQPISRPITKRVREILEALPVHGAYYFSGRNKAADKPLNNTVKLQKEIETRIGLWATPHDCRRLWASAAGRAGVPHHVTKQLMAHAGQSGDVTRDYQQAGDDELLDYSQQVEDRIFTDAKLLKDDPDALFASLTPEQKKHLLELAQQEARS